MDKSTLVIIRENKLIESNVITCIGVVSDTSLIKSVSATETLLNNTYTYCLTTHIHTHVKRGKGPLVLIF